MEIKFNGSLQEIVKEMESILLSIKSESLSRSLKDSTKPPTKKVDKEIKTGDRPRDKYVKLINQYYEQLKDIPGSHIRWFANKNEIPPHQSFAELENGALISTNYSNKVLERKIQDIKELLAIWK